MAFGFKVREQLETLGVIPLLHLYTLPINPYMPEWKTLLKSAYDIPEDKASSDVDTTSFKLSLQQPLLDSVIVQQHQEIFKPMLTTNTDAPKEYNLPVDSLRKYRKMNNHVVADIHSEVDTLEVIDLEQHGRRGSMRV